MCITGIRGLKSITLAIFLQRTPYNTQHFLLQLGPTGLVWAVLYNGTTIVRTAVKRDSLTGECWIDVSPPREGLKIVQISVGTNSVW